ncbi:TPA_asm: M protein [Sphaeridiorhabdovirus 2]|nr:TPA_asm: M protein [Sphaeridiorhabdovirus 2]
MSRNNPFKSFFKANKKSPSPKPDIPPGILINSTPSIAGPSAPPAFMSADDVFDPPPYDAFSQPGVVATRESNKEATVYNLSVCTKIIVSNVPTTLDVKVCQQLLYLFQLQFNGHRLGLPLIIYSLGRSLCKLESYGIESYLGSDDTVVSARMLTETPVHQIPSTTISLQLALPSGSVRVTITYEVQPSLFKGIQFPECVPEWIRDVMRSASSYQVLHDDRVGGFYLK